MDVTSYNARMNPLISILTEKAKRVDSIIHAPAEQVSTDSQCFENYGMLPDFDKIHDKEYTDSLFLLRTLIGKDILVSDLKKLNESKKSGMLESYLEGIRRENGNCAVCNRYSNSIEYFFPVRDEINKFYICGERITFFSGVSFYFEKSTGNFYEFQRIDKHDVKLGELILSVISRKEPGIRF